MKTVQRKQSGMTLMEMIASLAIIAMVVIGALALYNSASSTQQGTQMLKNIIAVRSATQQMYVGQGGYGTASLNRALIVANKIPSDMSVDRTNWTITTSWGGALTVTGATTNFTMELTQVASDMCIALLTGVPTGWSAVTVGGTAVTLPINTGNATTACSTGTAPYTIIWTTVS